MRKKKESPALLYAALITGVLIMPLCLLASPAPIPQIPHKTQPVILTRVSYSEADLVAMLYGTPLEALQAQRNIHIERF